MMAKEEEPARWRELTDPAITPARLRFDADALEVTVAQLAGTRMEMPLARWNVVSNGLLETAAALRATAEEITRLTSTVYDYEAEKAEALGAIEDLDRMNDRLRATLAARDALLRRAQGELQRCVHELIDRQSLSLAEYANALAAEIAATLGEEKDNG